MNDDFEGQEPDSNDGSDFTRLPPAPIPPHERQWRHPAELGAAQTVQIPVASSKSKTLAFVVVLASMITTVVFAQILRPVERGKSVTSTASASTNTFAAAPQPKGVLKMGDGKHSAVAFAIAQDTSFVVAPVDATRDSPPENQITGYGSTAVLLDIDKKLGLAIFAIRGALDVATLKSAAVYSPGMEVMVWDQQYVTAQIGLTLETETSKITNMYPLEIHGNASNGSPVFDNSGSLIGLLVRVDHSSWLLPLDQMPDNVQPIADVMSIVENLGFIPRQIFGSGVLIHSSIPESNFVSGDRVVKVGQSPINNLHDLAVAISTMSGGEAMFTILRGNKSIETSVRLLNSPG